jgi:hypothetical protein
VHLNCGTSIEATMLRRLPLSLEFLNTPLMAKHGPLPSQISRHADGFEATLAAIDDVEHEVEVFPFERNYRQMIHPWFHENDGSAADRVADAIHADLGSGARRRSSVGWSLGSSRRRSRLSQRLQALAANVAGSATTAAWRARATAVRREKRFAPAEVREAMAAIAAHEGRAAPLCEPARHPWTGRALASVTVTPQGAREK